MAEPSVPVKITCPECQGVINLGMNNRSSLISYRCQVGHTYSFQEMIKGKEVQVENHLWTVMGLFEHLEFLYETLLQEGDKDPTFSDHDRQLIRDRLECLARHKKLLGDMTEENTPAPLNDGD